MKTLIKQPAMEVAFDYEDLNDHDTLRHDLLMALLSDTPGCLRPDAIDDLLVNRFLAAFEPTSEEIILDGDATDDPVHGHQEGRFFHRYYRAYCYFPLYSFYGNHLGCARLRTADQDGVAGTKEELMRIIERIRLRWPHTRIIIRQYAILTWCETHDVDYGLGQKHPTEIVAILKQTDAGIKIKNLCREHGISDAT